MTKKELSQISNSTFQFYHAHLYPALCLVLPARPFTARPLLRINMLDRLVNRLERDEAQSPVESQRAFVMRGHFQIDPFDAGLAEALQGVEQQARAEAPVAMLRGNAEVLDRAEAAGIANSLHRAAMLAAAVA